MVATGLAVAASIGVGAGAIVRAEPLPGGGRGIGTVAHYRPRITVRIYDNTLVDDRARGAAMSRARRVLDSAGLASQFHDCSSNVRSSAKVCAASPAPGDLIIRMVQAPAGSQPQKRHVLGFATIDAETQRGTMATVFTDRVGALSRLARVPLETVLGRTIAHEIGHLLLGTNEHGTTGLMRETWTLEELANPGRQHWSFTAAELARLRGPA
jgi:hypothetical protein